MRRMDDDRVRRFRRVILDLGRPQASWPRSSESLPDSETWEQPAVINPLIANGIIEPPGQGFCLTERGQRIYDRIVTGQAIPDDWWG